MKFVLLLLQVWLLPEAADRRSHEWVDAADEAREDLFIHTENQHLVNTQYPLNVVVIAAINFNISCLTWTKNKTSGSWAQLTNNN